MAAFDQFPALVCKNCSRPIPLPPAKRPDTLEGQGMWPEGGSRRNFLCPACRHVHSSWLSQSDFLLRYGSSHSSLIPTAPHFFNSRLRRQSSASIAPGSSSTAFPTIAYTIVIITCQTHNSRALTTGCLSALSLFPAGVVRHRLRRLHATASLPAIKLIDALTVRAQFAFQKHTTSFAACDVVHDSSLTTNHPARCVRQHSPVTKVLNLDEVMSKNRRADTCTCEPTLS
jgi:hypothetical protein